VLHVGFGHENDELVSAVAGDHVGAAAVRFKDVAYTLKNEVAFEVAIKIVDELEAVKIHEDESEGPAGASGALPFGGKGFHEEAMSLDAGETVGDGLLLGFLEGIGVMQSARNQIGKCAEQKYLLFGEFERKRRFDVEHAMKLFGVEDRERNSGIGVREERLVRRVR
jgi:hypothetical protein